MSKVKLFNIVCGLTSLVLGVVYVIQANSLASQSWQLRDIQSKLTVLSEQRNALIAQQAEMDDRSLLERLAREQGLVSSGVVVYLVEDTAVATLR